MSGPIDYKALYEESERQRKESERAITILRLEAEQLRQRQQDADALIVSQQKELQDQQNKLHEIRQSQADQGIHPYLALMSRLHTYVNRLLPLETVQETEPTSAADRPATTGGRTSIDNKFYPLKMRVWSAFPELHKKTFVRILEADQGGLPSRQAVQVQEETILQRLPTEGVNIEFFLNETRTAQFLDVAWETPAWHIIRQFLVARNANHQVRFLSNLGARPANSAAPSSAASATTSAVDSSSNSASSVSSGTSAVPSAVFKVSPDCVVLAYSGQEPNRRLVLGEYKPCHALPSAKAAAIVQSALPEAYMVRLALEARVRRSRRRRTQLANLSRQQRADSVDSEAALQDDERLAMERDIPGALPRQVYFSHAITQAYHYMLVSGTAYGYVATGETMTVLHIPDDDPTCILYHTSVFPAPAPSAPASADADADATTGLVTAVPPLTDSDPADVDALLALPAAQLCSLCLLGYEADSTQRGSTWTATVLGNLSPFPRKPRSNASVQRSESPSSLGRRRRDDNDENDDEDEDGSGSGGAERGSRRRMLQPPGSGAASGSQVRTPSPLQQVLSSGDCHSARQLLPEAASLIRKPTLPYCTQACLRGLVLDGPLDPNCPNVAYHRRGPSLREPGFTPGTHHITANQLRELVRAQLLRAPEFDAECLYASGLGGAIGHLFKITATEYGYTLMAKAVQWQHRRRLRHEERVYGHLKEHQGVLVPVCLGGFELEAPFPLQDYYRVVTHMLLLSYGGVSVWRAQSRREQEVENQTRLQQQSPPPSEIGSQDEGVDVRGCVPVPLPWGDVDIEAATQQTMRTLWAAGFQDRDDNAANVLWCEETGRVMKIDFDRAHVVRRGDAQDATTDARKRAHDETDMHCHGQLDGKKAKLEASDDAVL